MGRKIKKYHLLPIAIGLLLSALVFEPVKASHELYAFVDSERILISGGDTAQDSTLTRANQSTQNYNGNIWLSYQSGIWPFRSTHECTLPVTVTVDPLDSSKGTIGLQETENTIGSSGDVEQWCGNNISDEQRDHYDNKSISIDTTNYTQSETELQRFISGSTYAKNYQNPPTSDTISLRRGGQTIDSATRNLQTDNQYGAFRFNDIDSGNYQICSSSADECKNVTKEFGQPLFGIKIGEHRAFDNEGKITLNLKFDFINPQEGTLIDELRFSIYSISDQENALQQVNVGPITYAMYDDSTLGATRNVTISESTQFRDIQPGEYTICDNEDIKCTNVTKQENSSSAAELHYSSSETTPLLLGLGDGEPAQTCEGAAMFTLGWLLCPILKLIYNGLDRLMGEDGIIGSSLSLNYEDEGRAALRTVWSGFNRIALFMFVVAFIALIYSAASGNLFSAYDVKTMLPRIIAMAILTQLSFDISMWTLAIFNDIGSGVKDLILFPVADSNLIPESLGTFFGGGGDETAVILALAGIGILIWTLGLTLLATALVAVITLWLIFMMRNIAITLLIVVSPLAFAAYVLPGTQEYFQKWWKWFIGFLALYPIMAAFLASGRLVSAIWIESGQANRNGIAALVAITATFIPYFLAPKVLTMSGGVTGKLGNMYNSGRHALSNLKQSEGIQRLRARAGANKLVDPNSVLGQRFGRTTRGLNSVTGAMARGKGGSLSRTGSRRTRARFTSAYEKMQSEDVQASYSHLNQAVARGEASGLSADKVLDAELGDARQRGDAVMIQAILSKKINETQDFKGVESELTRMQLSRNPALVETANRVVQENAGALAQKAPHLLKGKAVTIGSTTYHSGAGVVAEGMKPEEFGGMKPKTITTIRDHLNTMLTSNDLDPQQRAEAHLKLTNYAYQANEALTSPRIRENLSEDHIKELQSLVDFANHTPPPTQPPTQNQPPQQNPPTPPPNPPQQQPPTP